VTPWHGDYLHHVDLAEAAKSRLPGEPANAAASRIPRVKADASATPLVPLEWRNTDADWDIEITEVALGDLLAPATFALNGWQGPPWSRLGWFHAYLLLAGAASDSAQGVETDVRRLQSGSR